MKKMNIMRMNGTMMALAISSTLMSACIGGNCVKGTGNPVKKDIQVAPLHAIVLQGSLEVHLTQAETQSVTVEAQANLIDLIDTNVKDGVWTIRTSKCYSSDKPFIVHLSIPTVDGIMVQGSGDVMGKGTFEAAKVDLEVQGSGDINASFQAKIIKAEVQGSGDIKISGSCEEFEAEVQGSGDIKAVELKTVNAKTSVQGSGDITVQATGTLKANVLGSGDIRYKGTPASIDETVNGSGDVEPVK